MTQYVKIAKVSDIPEGSGRSFTVNDEEIAVFKIEGKLYAIDDTCTHSYASLANGTVCGHDVECPLHSGRFCVKTGQAKSPPVLEAVNTYPVRIIDDDIEIEISE